MARKRRAWEPLDQPVAIGMPKMGRNRALNKCKKTLNSESSMVMASAQVASSSSEVQIVQKKSIHNNLPSLLNIATSPPIKILRKMKQLPSQPCIKAVPDALLQRRKKLTQKAVPMPESIFKKTGKPKKLAKQKKTNAILASASASTSDVQVFEPDIPLVESPKKQLPVSVSKNNAKPENLSRLKTTNVATVSTSTSDVQVFGPDIPLVKSPKKQLPVAKIVNKVQQEAKKVVKLASSPGKKLDHYPRMKYDCFNYDCQIVVLPPEKTFIFFGWCGVTCLGGSVRIDGYEIHATSYTEGEVYSVCAPVESSRPAIFETTSEEKLENKVLKLKLRLKEVSPEFEKIVYDWQHFKAVILLINRKAPVSVDLFKQMHENNLYLAQNHWNPEDIDLLESPGWHLYRDYSLAIINNVLRTVDIKRQEGLKVTLLPCGEKGSGKSTFVRYLCNRLLSSELPLYLLDVDIGQPEFTPSGCMSLWKITKPILDLPWCHTQKDFINSYFYGDISPANDIPKYNSIFMRLLNDYIERSQPGSVLVINTLGWIDGPGRDALQYMIDWSVPDFILHMAGQQNKIANVKTTRATSSLQIHRDIPLQSKGIKWNSRVASLRPVALRELRTVCYFSHLLKRPIMSTLNQSKIYRVDFANIAIATPEDLSAIDDRYYLGTLNLQMIALCSTEEPLAARRLLDRNYLPLVCMTGLSTPMLKCYGYGIINAVDMEKRQFLVISPISGEHLAKVTVMVRGNWLSIPPIMTKSGDGNPAMYSMGQVDNTAGINVDLYNSVNRDRQDKFYRVHFPSFG